MAEHTLEQLRDRARELEIAGRSSMNAEQLAAAIDLAEGTAPAEEPATDAQASGAAIAAAPDVDATEPVLEPSTPQQVGRPDLLALAERRAANRNPRVIGAETQED